jgi:superfamily II DNA or RNA helicase
VSEEFMKETFQLSPINKEIEMPVQEDFYTMKNFPRDGLQERAIAYLCESGNHKVLSLNTNAGKTYISINAISRLKSNVIILVDTIALGEQWQEEFKKHTNISNVQLIDATDIENDLVEDGNAFIITEQSIGSLMLRDYHKLEEFIREKQIGIKIFDESHTRFHDLTRINNIFNTARTIYLTATFDRTYTEVKQWKEIFSGVKKMIEKTEERYREVHLVRFKTGSSASEYEFNHVVGLRGPSSILWGKYVISKEDKLRRPLLSPVIDNIIDYYKIKPRNNKTMCIIVPMNEMIERLKDHFVEKGYSVGVYTSSESKKYTTKDIFNNQIVLTNSSMFSKGIDIPNLKWLVNFTSVSSLISLEQVVGRLRGKESDKENGVYIDCVDVSFGDAFIKQQKTRKRYYKTITTDLELLKEKNVVNLYEE